MIKYLIHSLAVSLNNCLPVGLKHGANINNLVSHLLGKLFLFFIDDNGLRICGKFGVVTEIKSDWQELVDMISELWMSLIIDLILSLIIGGDNWAGLHLAVGVGDMLIHTDTILTNLDLLVVGVEVLDMSASTHVKIYQSNTMINVNKWSGTYRSSGLHHDDFFVGIRVGFRDGNSPFILCIKILLLIHTRWKTIAHPLFKVERAKSSLCHNEL